MNVQYLLAPGSADDIIWSLVQSKLRVVGNALDGHLAGTATGKSQPQTCPCLCLHTHNIVVGLDLLWLVWGGMPYPLNFKLCFSSIILVQFQPHLLSGSVAYPGVRIMLINCKGQF